MKYIHEIYRSTEVRARDRREAERLLADKELMKQTLRFMNCGKNLHLQ